VIAGVLLAAGASRRFGAPKLLQDVNGRPLLRVSAEALLDSVDALVVVVPAGDEPYGRALRGLDARVIVNAEAARGMATSLACALDAVPAEAEAAIVALADSPPSPDVLRRLAARHGEGGASIVAPSYRGVLAPPVLFARAVFAELRALRGDQGARVVVERVPDRVARIELDAPPPEDVDTPADLARLREDAQYSPHPPSSSQPPRRP